MIIFVFAYQLHHFPLTDQNGSSKMLKNNHCDDSSTDMEEAQPNKVVFKLSDNDDDDDIDENHKQEATDKPGPLVTQRQYSRNQSYDSTSSGVSLTDSEGSLQSQNETKETTLRLVYNFFLILNFSSFLSPYLRPVGLSV